MLVIFSQSEPSIPVKVPMAEPIKEKLLLDELKIWILFFFNPKVRLRSITHVCDTSYKWFVWHSGVLYLLFIKSENYFVTEQWWMHVNWLFAFRTLYKLQASYSRRQVEECLSCYSCCHKSRSIVLLARQFSTHWGAWLMALPKAPMTWQLSAKSLQHFEGLSVNGSWSYGFS